ncbi:hypothetical protein DB44_FF00190 [Candidatus Protochlamydia amoebophila]|uniref:Uncharacterized protein n=1 Tax=Candidatus Protochlamydia amoebophila TaxID=362787 RepID=A0A0C1H7S3_9BACT|nr:hypothetical protein DB44_FF00190 [Candidatus Protochlamydia amoebophila]
MAANHVDADKASLITVKTVLGLAQRARKSMKLRKQKKNGKFLISYFRT